MFFIVDFPVFIPSISFRLFILFILLKTKRKLRCKFGRTIKLSQKFIETTERLKHNLEKERRFFLKTQRSYY